MTQKDLLESVLQEIKHIKTHMPNGELKQMQKDLSELKEDMSDMKFTLLNPDDGVIVNTNKNTEHRVTLQSNQKDFDTQMSKIKELEDWKSGVTRALWIIFGSLVAIVGRMLMMHQGLE